MDNLITNYRDYKACKNGNIYSKKSTKWKLLKGGINKGGYKTIVLCQGGQTKRFLQHRLIAQTFIPNPENKPCVNHKNGIKTDNRVVNLEWATYLENNRHAWETGLITVTEEKKLKLQKSLSREIGKNIIQYTLKNKRIAEFESITEAARQTGINREAIKNYATGITTSITTGFIWGFKNQKRQPYKQVLKHIDFKCQECGKQCSQTTSNYKRAANHFCSNKCSIKRRKNVI